MPPKAKFTKEQITKAALDVVSEKGVQALTAKELGTALGTSTTPIFTVFHSMQEVQEEPKLYQLIFMTSISEAQTFDDIYAHLGSVADECLDVLQKDYDMSKENAKTLFEHVWIHTFGIGALCATGVCNFPHEQIAKMLSKDFNAMMMLVKSGKSSQPTVQKVEG